MIIDPPMVVRDLRKEVDPAVRWTPVQVPAEKNGWDLVIQATKAIPTPKTHPNGPTLFPKGKTAKNLLSLDLAKASPAEIEQAKAALKLYEPAFTLMDKALAKPVWAKPDLRDDVVPDVVREASILFPELSSFKELIKVRCLRARLRASDGDTHGAAQDLLASAHFGQRLAESDGVLIQYLVGVAGESIAYREIQTLVPNPKWQTSQLENMLTQLPDRKDGQRLARTLRREFDLMALRQIAGIQVSQKEMGVFASKDNEAKMMAVFSANPHPLDRKETIREGSRVYKEIVLNATRPYAARVDVDKQFDGLTAMWPPSIRDGLVSDPDAKPIPDSDWNTARNNAAKTSNPMGRLLLAQFLPVFSQADIAERKSQGMLRATRIALATAIYRKRHHAEPPDLGSLVKEGLLKARPIDPFSEKPLRYSAEQKLVWSIGPNPGSEESTDPLDRNGHPNGFAWPTDGIVPKPKGQ